MASIQRHRFRRGLARIAWVCDITVSAGRARATVGYDHHCGASTQHARRPLARREEPDARGTLQRDLPAALHAEHRHRPHQGRRADEDHGRPRAPPRTASRRSTAATATSAPRSPRSRCWRCRDLSLMVKAGVQWGLFGGAIENLGTERHHQAYVQEDHRPRPAGLLRDDRDRSRQRRAVAGDHGHLRPGDPGVRHRLPHPDLAQGLHRRRRRNRQGGSGIRAADHAGRREATACTASWCRSATTTATTCPA